MYTIPVSYSDSIAGQVLLECIQSKPLLQIMNCLPDNLTHLINVSPALILSKPLAIEECRQRVTKYLQREVIKNKVEEILLFILKNYLEVVGIEDERNFDMGDLFWWSKNSVEVTNLISDEIEFDESGFFSLPFKEVEMNRKNGKIKMEETTLGDQIMVMWTTSFIDRRESNNIHTEPMLWKPDQPEVYFL